jgi:3D (Asp-Asp-Asp) domain-containing protein
MIAQKQEEARKSEEEKKANLQYLGNYQLTAYPSGTGPNSYNGKSQTLNYTAASDFIPGGTWIYIEGYGEYYVEDSGVGNNYTIDLYMGDYNTCMQFGRKYNVPVYKILNK